VAGDVLVAIGFYLISLVYRGEHVHVGNHRSRRESESYFNWTVRDRFAIRCMRVGPLYLLGTPLALGSYCGLVSIAANDAISDMAAR